MKLIVVDGKGGKDWQAFAQVAHWCGSGVRLVVVEALVQVLTEAVQDMNRRYEVLSKLSDRECPEGKLTPGLSRSKRHNMPLVLIAIGPAAGYTLVLATQKPDARRSRRSCATTPARGSR
ncbi:hypothetical protein ACRYCC_27360 [Actinomadura scrupuli]|uniref:hypothetical protein n=1 Tax=Actinomadura scrupuli TaxID=559629 RepID=UPI003D97FA9F